MKNNQASSPPAQLKYTILIVEDVQSWQEIFKRYLQKEPFNISVASNYQDAVALIERQAFDLVILDVHLSEIPDNIDGLLIAKKLWLEYGQVKIILVTGTGDPNNYLNSQDFVPRYVLRKQTLTPDDLIEKIYAALAPE